jgi:RNA polymerase sigma-70 factor (ECF subfamily)
MTTLRGSPDARRRGRKIDEPPGTPAGSGSEGDRGRMDESDAELTARMREGDECAFDRLMERHRPAVYHFLRSLFADPGRAEDGAQETFLRLWLARHRYRPEAPLRSYLFRIARNYFLNRVRDEPEVLVADVAEPVGRPTAPLPETRVACEPAPLPDDLLVARYRLWRIRRAVASLPAHHRLVFTLAHDESLSYSEIARILEIPVGTVKSRMSAAVRMLRERLPREELE